NGATGRFPPRPRPPAQSAFQQFVRSVTIQCMSHLLTTPYSGPPIMPPSIGHRALTSQLAEDLGWLEEHSRQRGHTELAVQAGEMRLAAALVRNVIGPYLDGQAPTPLHIVVIGGAGA